MMATSDQCMYWGSAGMTAFTSASYQRSLLLSFFDDSREVVVTLIRLLSGRLALVVLLTFSRLHWQRAGELMSALLLLLDEAALPRGVGRFPAEGAVEFARLVEHCIEGVSVLFAPLTAAGSPRASLVNRHPL
jgi:hypothetical protein